MLGSLRRRKGRLGTSTLEKDLRVSLGNSLVTLHIDCGGEGEEKLSNVVGREVLGAMWEEVGEEVDLFISKLCLLPIDILDTGTLAYLRGGGDESVISSLKSSSSRSMMFGSLSSPSRLKSICFFKFTILSIFVI